MTNSIYFAVLLVLFGIVCYQVPQAIDKSIASTDSTVLQHKLSLTE